MVDRWLSPRIEDGETRIRGQVISLLALVTALIVPIYILVATITTPGEITAGGMGTLVAAFFLSLLCYNLCRRGHVRPAAYLLFGGLFVAISAYMLDPGNKAADLNLAPMLYIMIVLPAAYVIHPLASFVIAALAMAYTFGLLFLAPPAPFVAYDDKTNFLSNVLLIFAVTFILSAIAWIFSHGLEAALRQTRQQNQKLQQAAGELEAQRQIQAETGQRILEVAERLAQYSSRQARGASRQAAAVAQVSTSMSELSQAAQEIARDAGLVDHAAHQTLQGAQGGQEILVMHSDAMGLIQHKATQGASEATDLEAQLKQINRVATIMSNIASQIQLVAFNATLEAAEAGEAGNRFGVVAAEIKDLAADSMRQAKQVGQTVHQVWQAGEAVVSLSSEQVRAAEMGTSLTNRSSLANDTILGSAAQMTGLTQQIQSATAQQQQASEQILSAMQEIQSVADRWVVSSYQMDELVTNLKTLAGQLA